LARILLPVGTALSSPEYPAILSHVLQLPLSRASPLAQLMQLSAPLSQVTQLSPHGAHLVPFHHVPPLQTHVLSSITNPALQVLQVSPFWHASHPVTQLVQVFPRLYVFAGQVLVQAPLTRANGVAHDVQIFVLVQERQFSGQLEHFPVSWSLNVLPWQ
jgi:hypothetical protein